MIRPTPEWQQFEREYIRNSPKGWHANIGVFEELIRWAEYAGALPLADPLEGIEDDIKLAKLMNAPVRLSDGDESNRPRPE